MMAADGDFGNPALCDSHGVPERYGIKVALLTGINEKEGTE